MTISKWILRRQRKLIVVASILFFVLVIYILTFHEDIRIAEEHFQPFSERCRSGSAKDLIDIVCHNYTKGIAYGGLCKSLCVEHIVKIDECIHHGSTYVLLGKKLNEDIVIKRKKTHNLGEVEKYFEEYLQREDDVKKIRDRFATMVADEIRSSYGTDSMQLFLQNINQISKNLFGKNISKLSRKEMKNSWKLMGEDEPMMLALHQSLDSFPKLKGTCGPVYAMERIQPYSELFPEVIPTLSWFKRVKIALGFLKLLREFHATKIGPLHHCDVQEGNFGLTRNLEVMAIDVDLIYSTDRINEILPQPACKSDDECDFFDCHSKCDVNISKCTTTQITNNLQVVCRDIFLPQWPMSGLLTHFQPSHIKTKLNSLLNDCESKSFGLFAMKHSNVLNMMKELEITLHTSLQHRV